MRWILLTANCKSFGGLLAELTARVFRIEQALNLPLRSCGRSAAPSARRAASPSAAEPKPIRDAGRSSEAGAKSSRPSKAAPDLESRIGSHWLNRIGITAVLIGVSYFLKFAFDNNWIGPAGRVAIGLLAGIAVVVWSENFRHRGYVIFSYSLKAVGIGVLYLSLYAAFQVYSLVPGGVAFIMMFAVTAATAVMAWTQDAEILAAFALIGGFSTPLLLSTGQNREVALFAYVAILDLGALALVILKPWRRLLVLSYVGTLALYVGWYSSFYDVTQVRMTVGFATLFFAIFAVAPLLARPADEGTAVRFGSSAGRRGKCRRIFSADLRHVRGDRHQGHGMVCPGPGGSVHLPQPPGSRPSGQSGGGEDRGLAASCARHRIHHGRHSHTPRRSLDHYGMVRRGGRAVVGRRPDSFGVAQRVCRRRPGAGRGPARC